MNVEAEIKAFYTRLTTDDEQVQKQVEALTAKVQADYGGNYHVYNAQVVAWFPDHLERDVNQGYCNETGRYLVVQNVGLGRSKEVEYDLALVAEFEATVEIDTADVDSKHENRPLKVLSTKLVLRFLGFRNPNLSPVPPP